MHFLRAFKRRVSCVLVIALFSLQAMPVQAAMVDNTELLERAHHEISVQQIVQMLDQQEVQEKLIAMGVDPVDAKKRVSQMTSHELTELGQNIEQLPAGRGAVGVVLTVFIVLVITDMLGATDVFPFVKNINK